MRPELNSSASQSTYRSVSCKSGDRRYEFTNLDARPAGQLFDPYASTVTRRDPKERMKATPGGPSGSNTLTVSVSMAVDRKRVVLVMCVVVSSTEDGTYQARPSRTANTISSCSRSVNIQPIMMAFRQKHLNYATLRVQNV
jgi:hypothetical protein